MIQINKKPTVVLLGRANVGKSTLFNRLSEKNHALTSSTPGTTRDANLTIIEWLGYQFQLIDTGGILDIANLLKKKKKKTTDDIDTEVQKKVREYIKRADLILFLTDVRAGLLPTDKQMALILKKISAKNKIILVANKSDSPKLRQQTAEFNKLSLGLPLAVSAANGSGTGDLLDQVINKLKKQKLIYRPSVNTQSDDTQINISVIGKPNVGKSSLVNALIGENRIITSSVPHTTREPQDIEISYNNFRFKFIDTAGISRQGQRLVRHKKIKSLEKFSISKSLATLRKTDIALLVVDIKAGMTMQEAKLVEAIAKHGSSLIIIANKWDLIKEKNPKLYRQEIYSSLPFATWAPIHFNSALTGSKVDKIPNLIISAYQARQISISENALSKFLNRLVKKHKPVKARGTKLPHIYTLKQTGASPPFFTARIGAKDTLHQSYLNFIANRLREKFGFFATPIKVVAKKNPLIHGKHELPKK